MRFENYIKTKSLFAKRKGFFVADNNGCQFWRGLRLAKRCKICENRQFWVWTFALI